MKRYKRTTAFLLALAAVSGMASCSKGAQSSSAPEPVAELPTEAQEEDIEKPLDISGQTITWLADYDLNPSGDESRSAALSMFEDFYGASIVFAYTSPENRFERLSEMINGGEEVDMFPFENGAFPDGVIRDRFQPLDDYFDIMGVEDGLWDDMQPAIEKFKYKGEHYVMPYSLSSPQLIIYSRKLMQSEGLDDPYTLYQNNEWTWNVMLQMMRDFKAKEEKGKPRYGINGTFGQALICSSGTPIVSAVTMDDSGISGFTSNIGSMYLDDAGKLMETLVAEGLYDKTWKAYFPTNNQTLFYAMSDWALGDSNAKNPDSDIMAVPFPNRTGDRNYVSCTFDAKMLVQGSAKGEAVAAYLKCERIAASQVEYKAGAKALALENKGSGNPYITEEQYDAVQSCLDMTKVDPVYDYALGMGKKMHGSGDYTYESRGAADNLADALLEGRSPEKTWDELRDRWAPVIDDEIKKIAK